MTMPVGHEISADEYQSFVNTVNAAAAALAVLVPIVAVKPSDQIVNNSTTLVNDSTLLAGVTANTTYHFELGIRYSSNTTADLKTNWVVPSGCLMTFDIIGVGVGAANTSIFAWDSNSNFSFEGNALGAFRQTGIVKVGGTPGNIQFQWAQNTANASDTKVLTNSYLQLNKLF